MEVCIGKVLKPKGLKGEIIVYFFKENLKCKVNDILFFEKFDKKLASYRIKNIKFYKKYEDKILYLLELEPPIDLQKVNFLKSSFIIKDFEFLPQNIFLKSEILGCNLILYDKNKNIGKVIDIINLKNNYSLLVGKSYYKNLDFFIPFIKEIVKVVDIKNKVIFLNSIEGITDFDES